MGRKRHRHGSKVPGGRIPAYLSSVAALAAPLEPGTVNHVNVSHDATCDLLKGRGACTCKPEVQLVRPS